jgi:8-oxo-dGTP pyrophosphatase MutT (NUDIX family)
MSLAPYGVPYCLRVDREPTPEALRAAMALSPFDGRAAQRPLEPRFRGVPPPDAPRSAPREGAALLYAFPTPDGLRFPLTLRREDLAEHRGQVSLPGGRPDPGEPLWSAALRESDEELGLDARGAERLGVLAPVYIPVTHTHLSVHVALGPEPSRWIPAPGEVARLVFARLCDLVEPTRRIVARRHIRGRDVEVPAFLLEGLEVWGATAMALSQVAERLRRV